MTTELAVIVDAAERWYVACVVNGTVERYYPKPWARLRRPTAQWARRAGERWIRRYRRWESRRERRAARARRATRPTEPVHWVGDAPTSLHGNGASSFARTSRDAKDVTCTLCLTLLARESTEQEKP